MKSIPVSILTQERIRDILYANLAGKFTSAKILVLIPDHTRSIPLPMLFRLLVNSLHDTRQLDFMVALGTHPPLNEKELCALIGISLEERNTTYKKIGLFNHAWDNLNALVQIGTLTKTQIQGIAGQAWHPTLGGDVPIRINKVVFEYDHILILGPTFPHEVVGMSGGAKYLFPGISGPEMINVTHWLGALIGVINTIGIAETPVRTMIHAAAKFLTTPVTLIALVVENEGLAGIFIDDYITAWRSAAELSSQRHIRLFQKPFRRVLSCSPPMYDELWTAAKAMYKLEPVVADGGEVIIYAPHLDTISHVHGKYIYEIGYHVLDYFLKQWKRFEHIPLGVLAHSTHMRGVGSFVKGIEYPRVKVTLSSQISQIDCERLSIGYQNPEEIDIKQWENQESEELLFVPKAGETLCRTNSESI